MYIVQTRILIRINCDRTGSVSDAYFPLRAEVNGCVFQISIPSHSRKIIQKNSFLFCFVTIYSITFSQYLKSVNLENIMIILLIQGIKVTVSV